MHGLTPKVLAIGGGSLRPVIEEAARERGLVDQVTFLPALPQQHLLEYMRAADLMVLPSTHDGCPTVVLEAMAAGVAVLATRYPTGPEEIITPGENGALCDISAEGLRELIEVLGASAALRDRLAEGGHRRIQDFDLLQILGQYENFFIRCVGFDPGNFQELS